MIHILGTVMIIRKESRRHYLAEKELTSSRRLSRASLADRCELWKNTFFQHIAPINRRLKPYNDAIIGAFTLKLEIAVSWCRTFLWSFRMVLA